MQAELTALKKTVQGCGDSVIAAIEAELKLDE
jgi:hypothetical protein